MKSKEITRWNKLIKENSISNFDYSFIENTAFENKFGKEINFLLKSKPIFEGIKKLNKQSSEVLFNVMDLTDDKDFIMAGITPVLYLIGKSNEKEFTIDEVRQISDSFANMYVKQKIMPFHPQLINIPDDNESDVIVMTSLTHEEDEIKDGTDSLLNNFVDVLKSKFSTNLQKKLSDDLLMTVLKNSTMIMLE